MPKKKVARKRRKAGPKPETLKIEGNWKDAVKTALHRGKPPNEGGSNAGKTRTQQQSPVEGDGAESVEATPE